MSVLECKLALGRFSTLCGSRLRRFAPTLGAEALAAAALAVVGATACGVAPPQDFDVEPYSALDSTDGSPEPLPGAGGMQGEPIWGPDRAGPRVPERATARQFAMDEPSGGIEYLSSAEMCAAPSPSCGGSLEGTWVVDESCNSEVESTEQRWNWGSRLLGLRGDICRNAVQRMTSRWSGQIQFDSQLATDARVLTTTLEAYLGASCLTSTLESETTIQVSESSCKALELKNDAGEISNKTTTCHAEPGRCVCSQTIVYEGQGNGWYRYDGDLVIVENQGSPIDYEYCVDGSDRIVWWEEGNRTSKMILRRRQEAPVIVRSPTETPRLIPRP